MGRARVTAVRRSQDGQDVYVIAGLPAHPRDGEDPWDAAARAALRHSAGHDVEVEIRDQSGTPLERRMVNAPARTPVLEAPPAVEPSGPVDQALEAPDPEAHLAQWRTRRERREQMLSARSSPRLIRIRPAALVVVAAFLAVLVGIGAVVVSLQAPAGIDLVRGHTLSAAPPLAYQRQAQWTTPKVQGQSGMVLVVDDAVAVITKERTLALIDLATGDPRWTASVPDAQISGELMRSDVDGVDSILLHVGDDLLWWSVTDGAQHSVGVPEDAQINVFGDSPLVSASENSVAVIQGGTLAEVRVPRGAQALAARSTGTVTVAGPAGWWHLTPGQAAGPPRPWEDPAPNRVQKGATPTVVGYQSDTILTLWPAPNKYVLLAGYADEPRIRTSFTGSLYAPEGKAKVSYRWQPSPSRTWGVLSRAIVDTRTGTIEDLGALTASKVIGDRALAVTNGQRVVIGPSVPAGDGVQTWPVGVAAATEVFPEGVTAQGALVLDHDGTLSLLAPSQRS